MIAAGYRIRRLESSDVEILRPVRLDALRLHPTAFHAAYEEEAQASLDEIAQRLLLPPATIFGGFAGDSLVGATGLLGQPRIKLRHRADVFFVYVDAAHRHSGLGRTLVETAIAHARDAGVLVLRLAVTVGNDSARRLYAALGFRSYAIVKRAMQVDGVFYDEEHMALDLD